MEKHIYIAAQYLAAAGISFLKKESDDSHTNLGFNTDGGYLETHPLSENNDKLIFHYKSFSLEWRSNTESVFLKLDGKTHKDIVKWISENASNFLKKEYKYDLHYDLPYVVSDTTTFELSGVERLGELVHMRSLSQFILEKINATYNLNASIRIWPHHFDTGIYSVVPESDISIGLGMAIPDTVCDEHYLYITGYSGSNVIDISGLEKLSIGEWKSDGFMGAILKTNGVSEPDGVSFFEQVIDQLIKK